MHGPAHMPESPTGLLLHCSESRGSRIGLSDQLWPWRKLAWMGAKTGMRPPRWGGGGGGGGIKASLTLSMFKQ